MDYDLLRKTYKRFLDSFELEKAIDTNTFERKTYLDSKSNPQYCRFCNRYFPEVSFKTDSHLIPQFLGSKYLLSHFECDNCNSHFKSYENDFANFIGVIRSIAGITGKSRNPKLSTDKLKIFQEEDKTIRFVSADIVKAIENGDKQIMIPAVKNKFTPINVYRAILKIALGLIEESEVNNFRSAFEFLLSDDDIYYNKVKNSMTIMRIFVPGPSVLESPHVHLWKRKSLEIEMPEKLAVIHVKNLKYIIPIPLNKNDNHLKGKSLEVPMCPIILPDTYVKKYGNFQFEAIDLSGKEVIKGKDDTIGLNISNLKKYSR